MNHAHLIIRPIETKDLDDLYTLSQAGGVGITTLPADREALERKIDSSRQAFAGKSEQDAYYLFVLEDTNTNQVVGCSAIDAFVGGQLPFYSYKVSKETYTHPPLEIRQDYHVLYLSNDYHHKTELCTLFLSKDYRVSGVGRFLSRARLLYLANFKDDFSDVVFAEMRGVSDAQGSSPFWESLCQHFFPMNFAQASLLSATTDKQFIQDLMPKHPIYLELLSPEAREVFAKAHESTKAAVAILEKEGFRYNQYVDVFDAGPVLEVGLKHIKTIRESASLPVEVKPVVNEDFGQEMLLSNQKKDFRALRDRAFVSDVSVEISQSCAQRLGVQTGDRIRVAGGA